MTTQLLNLETNPAVMCTDIEGFIRESMDMLNRDGAVIGLSGGLDSAVTAILTVRSLGADYVHLLYMPERDSNPQHRGHAKRFANELGIRLVVHSIRPALRALRTYQILPLSIIPGRQLRKRVVEFGRRKLLEHNDERILTDRLQGKVNPWITKGNAYAMTKHRLRMVMLYQYAELRNLMVVGAANRTEALTGTFSQWGVDHCADIMPVIHAYRSQLEEIANFIGIPDYIRKKPSDPDLLPVDLNKGEMMGGFEVADQILHNMVNGVDLQTLYIVYDKKLVDYIHRLKTSSAYLRESPYHL